MGAAAKLREVFVGTFIALFVALFSGLYALSEPERGCSDDSHCRCPAGWPEVWCWDGKCYGGRAETRCVGRENGHVPEEGMWCWHERATRDCSARPSQMSKYAKFLRKHLTKQFGPYYPAIVPLMEMKLFRSDRSQQINVCYSMGQYGWNDPASKEPLLALGAIDSMVLALKAHPDDKEVQSSCLNGIAALCLYNRPASLRAGELGVVEMTANAWRRWFTDKNFQIGGNFGCYQDFAMENRQRMLAAGAIKLMLDSCGEDGLFYWDPNAQFQTWCGFSSFHSPATHEEFFRLGGLRSAYVVFRDHAASYRVREEILQTMKGICAHRAYREELAREGFMSELISALGATKNDPQVVALGIEVLRMFVDANATLRRAAIEAGSVAIAQDALRTHAGGLQDTRAEWDKQNVYGALNDDQYNIGGAAELLYSLALDGPETRGAMLEGGTVQQLLDAVAATANRIESVRGRTWVGACATLRQLAPEAEAEAAQQVASAISSMGCPSQINPPAVITNTVPFEP